ncbi:MAG: sigma-70 family RNA polymerase sigma factor [Verrucomicrobiota bacterium]
MDTITDQELIAQVSHGDEAAFSEIVRRYQNMVYGTAYKMLGHHHSEAEDVAQTVFIRVFKAAGSYRPKAAFKTWLMTITRNCVFTQLKKSNRDQSRHQPLEFESDGEVVELPIADPSASTSEDEMIRSEMKQVLEKAIRNLPESQRTALVLRQYEQMDYEAIAQSMKTSVSSVKSLLFRARESLRCELDRYLA